MSSNECPPEDRGDEPRKRPERSRPKAHPADQWANSPETWREFRRATHKGKDAKKSRPSRESERESPTGQVDEGEAGADSETSAGGSPRYKLYPDVDFRLPDAKDTTVEDPVCAFLARFRRCMELLRSMSGLFARAQGSRFVNDWEGMSSSKRLRCIAEDLSGTAGHGETPPDRELAWFLEARLDDEFWEALKAALVAAKPELRESIGDVPIARILFDIEAARAAPTSENIERLHRWLEMDEGGQLVPSKTPLAVTEPGVPPTGRDKPGTSRTYTVAAVCEMMDLSSDSVNKYAKLANVTTPARGKRNHRYSFEDVVSILRTTIENTNEARRRTDLSEALRNLEQTGK
jgi:hypothetical protein